jgi:thioredoxin 1
MSSALAVTDATFDTEVLASSVPVLVDFGATWCPPCRAIGPEVDAAAETLSGRARVVTVDVDENGALAERYGIRGIPALLLFKGGRVVEQTSGYRPRQELVELVLDYVEGAE